MESDESAVRTICMLKLLSGKQLEKAINLFTSKSIIVEDVEEMESNEAHTIYKLQLRMDSEELARTLKWLDGEVLKFSFSSKFSSQNEKKQDKIQALNDLFKDIPMSPFADVDLHRIRQEVDAAETPWFPITSAEIDHCSKKVLLYGNDVQFDYPGYEREDYRQRRYLLGQLAMNYYHKNPIPRIQYNNEEFSTWQMISKTLSNAYPIYACREFYTNFNELIKNIDYGSSEIPQLADVNEHVKSKTGFSLRPVAGYLSPRDFLYSLAFRIFPCTQYIRMSTNVDYTPEPDCCHELLGHIPMLIDQEFTELTQKIGLASIGANEEDIEKLAKLYFFTLEFGLCVEDGKIKALGAGLLSSPKELQHAVTCKNRQISMNPENILKAECMITSFQNQYFVAKSYGEMIKIISDFCDSISKPFQMTYDQETGSIEIMSCLPRAGKLLRDIESDIAIVFNVPESIV
ncbi:hypothetical protein ACOME3_002337 [Neoechinorhynchus agilis]